MRKRKLFDEVYALSSKGKKVIGNLDDQFPVAARLNTTAFYIGCHPDLTDDNIDYVIEHFRRFFGSRI